MVCLKNDFNDCESLCKAFYLEGCNLSCPYCYNPDLALYRQKQNEDNITVDEALDEIDNCVQTNVKTKEKFLTHEWIAISGGEPLASYKETLTLIKRAKERGLKVKLFTNGTRYKALKDILPLIDAVSIDIKEPENKNYIYFGMFENLLKSLDLVTSTNKELIVDFRTVCVAPYIKAPEAELIRKMLVDLYETNNKPFRWTLAKFLHQSKLILTVLPKDYLSLENTFLGDGFAYTLQSSELKDSFELVQNLVK